MPDCPASKIILSDGAFAQYGSGLGSKALEVPAPWCPACSPRQPFRRELVEVDPALKDLSFAAEAYDAVNLAAWPRLWPMTTPGAPSRPT